MGCYFCGNLNTEQHHIIFRSQCKPLQNCKYNIVELCVEHHRGCNGVHGKNGSKLNIVLRKNLQKKINSLLKMVRLNNEGISSILQISEDDAYKLTKGLILNTDGVYDENDVLRKILGGKLYL